MQVRGLLVAVVLLGLLAGGVYWSERQKAGEEAKNAEGGASKLIHIANTDVRKLEILRRDSPPLILERDASNQWQMRAPETWRVDQDAATEVAGSYVGLAYDRVLEDKATDLAGYGLDTPAVALAVTGEDGKTGRLLIGDESPTGTGVYAKLDGDARVFLVSTATKTSIDKAPKDLRDKRLLSFETNGLTGLVLASKGAPIEFGRNAAKEWQIVKPKPRRADNGKVDELLQKLSDARMDTSILDEEAAKAPSYFAAGSRVATATTVGAKGTQVLEVRKRGEEYFAKSSVVEGVFKIGNDVGEALNKGIEEFENKKLFDFSFNEPSVVTVRDNDKSYAFKKSGENWTNAGGKAMDATSVQSLIDKLRDLSASRLVEAGFTAPVIEASVTWNDGKRTEKIAIAKTATGFLAQRENEPVLYELDAKAVEELQRAAADVKEPPPPPAKK